MKTIDEALRAASHCLAQVGLDNPRMESEHLLAAMLNIPRTHLVLRRHEQFTDASIRKFQRFVRLRQERKPLAYICGEQPFRDLRLKVTPAVLIPRPETELVVEQALRLLDAMPAATAIDVGTGSGAIALSLSVHPNVRRTIGLDVSLSALAVAKTNAEAARRYVEWLHGDLLQPVLDQGIHADLVVANLPYVRRGDLAGLEAELHWEPSLALDGGVDGLGAIRRCIPMAMRTLKPGGFLLLEIGFDQADEVKRLITDGKGFEEAQLFRDWAGLPRIIQARTRGNS